MGSKNFTRESADFSLSRFVPREYLALIHRPSGYVDDGGHLIVWAAAEIATTIMAASIPVMRVLFRELRDPHPVETSGTGNGKYYRHRKSEHSGETCSGDGDSPAAAVALAHLAADQRAETETASASKPWGVYWDFGKGSSRVSKMLGTKLRSATVAATEPYPLARSSSQRVLVQVSGESNDEEALQAEGVIVQTHEFEIKYSVPRGAKPGEMP